VPLGPSIGEGVAQGVSLRGRYEGFGGLEPDPERQRKYLDFIDIDAALDENERIVYRQRSPEEVAEMTRFAERFMQLEAIRCRAGVITAFRGRAAPLRRTLRIVGRGGLAS